MRTFPSRFSPVALACATGRAVVLLLAAAYAFAPIDATAQFALRSTIEGTVKDSTAGALPGATVTLTETTRDQVQTATADEHGAFVFSNVAPGTYTVSAALTGFVTATSEPVTLGSATNANVNLVLQVGGVTETVQVVREVPVISTDQIAIGVAVDKTLIDTISSKGRNFTSFVQLAPGISTQPRTDNAGTWSAGSHHTIGGIDYVAGGGGNNGFYVNGVNANDNWVGGQSYSPSLEAVDEIKVDVANFSAANGRDLSSLSVTTRAGTNAFHGSVFDYVEDESLNAWDPLEKLRVAEGTKKPTLDRHQFGGNIGGPIFRNKRVLLRQLRADLQQAWRRAVLPARAHRGGTARRLQRAAPAFPGRSELRALQPLHDRHHRGGREHP